MRVCAIIKHDCTVGTVHCIQLCIIGNNRPTLKLLNKFKDSVGTKWYDLGIELLDDKDCDKLDAIQSDHSKDVSSCCTQMFKLWLNLQPSASWNQLIQALREPNIGKDGLAKEIETKIKSINQGNFSILVVMLVVFVACLSVCMCYALYCRL